MNNKWKTIYAVCMLICGCFETLGLLFLFQGCPKSDHVMMCQIASKVVHALGAAMMMNSVFLFLSKQKGFHCGIALNNLMLSVTAILIPLWIIGGCKNMTMRCHTVSFPMIYIVSTIAAIVSLLFLLTNRKKEEFEN